MKQALPKIPESYFLEAIALTVQRRLRRSGFDVSNARVDAAAEMMLMRDGGPVKRLSKIERMFITDSCCLRLRATTSQGEMATIHPLIKDAWCTEIGVRLASTALAKEMRALLRNKPEETP